MVNWKAYKIIRIDNSSSFLILFELEDYIDYGEHCGRQVKGRGTINCANNSPYNTYRVGDWLEVDLDRVGDKNGPQTFNDTSIARKVGSSVVVPRNNDSMVIPSISQGQVNTIIGQINSAINSDERNEYEAKMHVDSSGKYSGFSLIGRRK